MVAYFEKTQIHLPNAAKEIINQYPADAETLISILTAADEEVRLPMGQP